VEGETDATVFTRWFAEAAEARGDTPDSLNLVIEAVGSDSSFGVYRSLLDEFGIRWAIVSDGPVLGPAHPHPLAKQLGAEADANMPDNSASFEEWLRFWNARGVFTPVSGFDEEIEAYLSRLDPQAAADAARAFPRSKVRQGMFFAEAFPCPPEIAELYRNILSRLGTSRV
jgi:hypothetical protein